MKTKVIFITIFTIIIFVSNSYSQVERKKMVENSEKIKIEIIDNFILVDQDNKATLKYKIIFPAKYFKPNVQLKIFPTISFDNGMKLPLDNFIFKGEEYNSQGQEISYVNGGSKQFTENFNYTEGQKKAVLTIKAQFWSMGNFELKTIYSKEITIKKKQKEEPEIVETETNETETDEIETNEPDKPTKQEITNTEQNEEYYLQKIQNAKDNNDFETVSKYMDSLAIMYANNALTDFEQHKLAKSYNQYLKAIKIKQELKDTNELVTLYANIGVVAQTQSNYEGSIEFYEKAISLKKKQNDSIAVANLTYQMSNVYSEQDDYESAIKNYEQIIQIEENTNNTKELFASYNNIAILQTKKNEYATANDNLNKALNYYNENNDTLARAKTLNNIANNYFYQKKYDDALKYYKKALDIKKQTPEKNKESIAISLHNIANVYSKKGEIDKATDYYNESNKYAKQCNSHEVQYKNNYNLAQIISEQEECSSAINYYKKYINFRFNLTEEEQNPISENIDKYVIQIEKQQLVVQLDKTKSELYIQKQLTEKTKLEKELQKAKTRKFKHISIAIGLGLLLAIILAFLFLRQYILKKKEHKKVIEKLAIISQQNEEILSQSEQIKQANEEIKVINEDLQQQKDELQTTLDNLKKTQTQLIESEKMASLGQLIAGVAHELNTPLGAINSSISNVRASMKLSIEKLPILTKKLSENEYKQFITLITLSFENNTHYTSREGRKLKRKIKKNLQNNKFTNADIVADTLADMEIFENYEQFHELFKHKEIDLILSVAYNLSVQNSNSKNIAIAVARSSKIISALRNYSHKYDSEEMTEYNITQGIETVLTLFQNKFKGNIIIEKKYQEIPLIKCYPDELNQVWTNIINNAYQAMDGKGNIYISILQKDNFVRVAIKDKGKGIPEDIKEKIFNPFFTTKIAGEGTGLGLDISKKIIEKHNGKINFESIEEEGTTFYIQLPI